MLLSLAALASLAGATGEAAAETGVASFYAKRFAGRTMADGTPMDPHGDNAASRTLPLGSRARVTNLQTGQSAFVTIRDRGPYVKGRIVDLSPASARLVGITPKAGLAKVEVTPITRLAANDTRAAPWN
jgi:rare lipoprotein A